LKEETMGCHNIDETKPLDRLILEKTDEFNSGEDRACDKDLDALIWKLGDFENEEPPQEAGEFEDDLPIEEELVEGEKIVGGTGQAPSTRGGRTDDAVSDGVNLTSAHSISRATRRKR
jgi:hypothetical protein